MTDFSTEIATGKIIIEESGSIVIIGQNRKYSVPQYISWIAAAPATCGESWAGSGLPFPNRHIAYDTPEAFKGRIRSADGRFTIRLKGLPNAFYTGLGSSYVPPHIRLDFVPITPTTIATAVRTYVELTTGIPFRLLTDPAQRKNVGFYAGNDMLPIRTAEETLRDSAYPTEPAHKGIYVAPVDFWGAVPRQ